MENIKEVDQKKDGQMRSRRTADSWHFAGNRLISTDTTYIFYGMRWPGTNINKIDRP